MIYNIHIISTGSLFKLEKWLMQLRKSILNKKIKSFFSAIVYDKWKSNDIKWMKGYVN